MPQAKSGKKPAKKKKIKLSPEEQQKLREKRDHIRTIRSVLNSVGFERAPSISDKEFTYKGTTSDFDDAFRFENVIVLSEYTTAQESDVSTHLKKKKVLYDKIRADPAEFLIFLKDKFPDFSANLDPVYDDDHYRIVILYCSRHHIKQSTKAEVPGITYFDYRLVRYFKSVSDALKKSGRPELLHFFGLSNEDVGGNVIAPQTNSFGIYEGSVLPEAHSNFDKGFKVVSFYVDPEALLSRCYVLRKDGWQEGTGLYQRMVSKGKISAIRRYLLERKRVFVNNIIVTLPSDTNLVAGNKTIDISDIKKTTPTKIQIPVRFNSIGIIDGQHRIFSYHEGGSQDADIGHLRKRQNLLVTGIIYPQTISDEDRIRFEANLFLEINSNQTNAKSDLKQAIGVLIRPFAPDSVARQVVNMMNDNGPLENRFQRYFYDKDKLKITTVVSYGLKPLVKTSGEDSLFSAWDHPQKQLLVDKPTDKLVKAYTEFCAVEINKFMSAVKARIPKARWTSDKKVANRFLTTTNINGFIVCLRRIVEAEKLGTFDEYYESLENLDEFKFSTYRSSQYIRMGEALFRKYF